MTFTNIPNNFCTLLSLAVLAGGVLVVLFVIARYAIDVYSIRSYPGPWAAKLSHAWLGWEAFQGRINNAIHKAHQKYGTFIRIAPNHVSIADLAALQLIYGHGTDAMKSDFYTVAVHFSGTPSVFTTRSREDHARKRKILSHVFAPKSVQNFEPIIRRYQLAFIKHWDDLAAAGAADSSGSRGSCNWVARDGRAWFDCMPWFSFHALDVIGDLAFGASFRLLEKLRDNVVISASQTTAINALDTKDASFPSIEISPVKAANKRSEYTTCSAVWPMWVRHMLLHIPWFATRSRAMENIATLAVTALAKRLSEPLFRHDLLSQLLDGKNDGTLPLSNRELSAEVSTLLSAGSDTTSNTMCAIIYNLAKNPRVQVKLQKELEEVLGKPDLNMCADDYSTENSLAERVKYIKYLEAVVNETLRLHSTVGMGLPRIVPEGGLTILGKTLTPGTIVSVPGYTLHRHKSVFGEDADEFRPERWLEENTAEMRQAFIAFSVGPRACLGRNVALLSLTTFTAMIAYRYDITLECPEQSLAVRDGFLRKVLSCSIGIKRRG